MAGLSILNNSEYIYREYITKSLEQTKKLGSKIASSLKAGDVIAMSGDLGAGKTSLTQGISRGLGVSDNVPVTSPTFTIVNHYESPIPVYHIDFYRIRSGDEFFLTGLDEFFVDSAITIVEWADKFPSIIPESAIWVNLELIDAKSRRITLRLNGNGDEKRFAY